MSEDMDEEQVGYEEEPETEEKQDEEVDTQEWAEQNFEAVKQKMKQIQNEMRNSKPEENINVRKVETDNNGTQIIVEHTVSRWYSPEYFKKMLEDDQDTIF